MRKEGGGEVKREDQGSKGKKRDERSREEDGRKGKRRKEEKRGENAKVTPGQ